MSCPPSPHPSLPFNCPETHRSACLSDTHGAQSRGTGPHALGGGPGSRLPSRGRVRVTQAVHRGVASGEQLSCPPHFVSRKSQRKAVWNKLSAPRPVESLNYGRPHLGHGEEELAFYLPRGYLVCFWGSSNISGFYLVLNLSLGKSCLS